MCLQYKTTPNRSNDTTYYNDDVIPLWVLAEINMYI